MSISRVSRTWLFLLAVLAPACSSDTVAPADGPALPPAVDFYRNVGDVAVLRIDTAGIQIVDEPKVPAVFRVWRANTFLGTDTDTPADDPHRVPDETYVGGIEVRGASSQLFPKKCFGVELWTDAVSMTDRAVALLGLPAESDWVLYGPYDDKALLRNWLAYRVAGQLGRYAPRTRFAEVFMDVPDDGTTNVVYAGLYLLVEKVKRDAARVAVARLTAAQVAEPDVTGGYLAKIDKPGGAETAITTAAGTTVLLVYPKPADLAPAQRAWIAAYLDAAEASLTNDARFAAREYLAYWDLESFADFFLVNELAKNVDGFRISSYFSKDRAGKLAAGPVWDCNITFGNANYYDGASTSGWQIDNTPAGDMVPPFWWTRFRADPLFWQTLAARWRSARAGVLAESALAAMLDDAVAALGSAIGRNFAAWPVLGTYVWPNAVYYGTYTEELAYLKNWIHDRLAWIDAALAGY